MKTLENSQPKRALASGLESLMRGKTQVFNQPRGAATSLLDAQKRLPRRKNISGSSSSFLQFPRKVVSYLGDFILEIVFFFFNSKTDIRMGVLVQSLIRQEQFRLRMNRRGRTFA